MKNSQTNLLPKCFDNGGFLFTEPQELMPVYENKKFLKKKYKEPIIVYTYYKEISDRAVKIRKKINSLYNKAILLNGKSEKASKTLVLLGNYYDKFFRIMVEEFDKNMHETYRLSKIPYIKSQICLDKKWEHELFSDRKSIEEEVEKRIMEIRKLEKIYDNIGMRKIKRTIVDHYSNRYPNGKSKRFEPTVSEYLEFEKINYEAEHKYFSEEEELDAESHEIWRVNNNPFAPNNSHQEIEKLTGDLSKSMIGDESKVNDIFEEEAINNRTLLDSDYEELCRYKEELLSESYIGSVIFTNNTRYPNLGELESIPKLQLFPGMPSHFFTWYIEEFMKLGEGCENIILESPYNYSEEILHKLETQKHFMTKEEKKGVKANLLIHKF